MVLQVEREREQGGCSGEGGAAGHTAGRVQLASRAQETGGQSTEVGTGSDTSYKEYTNSK